MNRQNSDQVTYLRFSILEPYDNLLQGVFTRQGGVSPDPFSSLNLATAEGDDPRNVSQNRRIVTEALGLGGLAWVRQVHGTDIFLADGRAPGDRALEMADGMITRRPGLGLLVKQADCQAVVMFDPVTITIANIHCGWRGNVNGILQKAVSAMRDTFGVDPAHILAGIGPSLGPCCAQFVNFDVEFGPDFAPYKVGDDRVDLWRLSKDQLIGAGLEPGNVEIMGLCTGCRTDLFFSYRAEKPVTGRFGTVIGLEKNG